MSKLGPFTENHNFVDSPFWSQTPQFIPMIIKIEEIKEYCSRFKGITLIAILSIQDNLFGMSEIEFNFVF